VRRQCRQETIAELPGNRRRVIRHRTSLLHHDGDAASKSDESGPKYIRSLNEITTLPCLRPARKAHGTFRSWNACFALCSISIADVSHNYVVGARLERQRERRAAEQRSQIRAQCGRQANLCQARVVGASCTPRIRVNSPGRRLIHSLFRCAGRCGHFPPRTAAPLIRPEYRARSASRTSSG
jgi:hypothetical protein